MNKKLLAVAVAAFVAAPAVAMADTTLFGQFKYEVGYIEDGSDRNLVHSTRGTRLGVHGREDLGGGTSAIFRFQSGFGGVNNSLATRNFALNEEAWVGLRGNFGTVLLGRHDTPFKKSHGFARAFTDTLADDTTRPVSNGRAEGVHYTTPDFNGFSLMAAYEPNGAKTDGYWSVGATYRSGPIFLGAAVEGASDTGLYQGGGKSSNLPDRTNWQVGANFTLGDGTIGVLYQDIEDVEKLVIVPLTYKLGNIGLRGAVKYRDFESGADDAWNWSVGVQYNFSRRTELFANVWYDDEVSNTPGGAAEEAQFGLGLRHSF